MNTLCNQQPPMADRTFLARFHRKLIDDRVPLTGSFALTHRCNLNCVHCYLGDHRRAVLEPEMDTSRILSVLDEIAEAGCLFLVLTGGEPLLREDFCRIYTHARERGLLVSVFTNGTLISDGIASLFADRSPQCVEITLYGAVPETHERITGVGGSFRAAVSGIETLLKYHVRVKLKTILMRQNLGEFEDLEELAESYGIGLRHDAMIFPRFNGDRSPLDLRIDAREAVDVDLANPDRRDKWLEFFLRTRNTPFSNQLYRCGAGVTNFHVDPAGMLQPCLMMSGIQYDLNKGRFIDGWNGCIATLQTRKAPVRFPCNTCSYRPVCGFCPPFFNLESGSETVISDFLCKMGQYRYHSLERMASGGSRNAVIETIQER